MDIKFADLYGGTGWDTFLHPSIYFHNGSDFCWAIKQDNLIVYIENLEKFFCVCVFAIDI